MKVHFIVVLMLVCGCRFQTTTVIPDVRPHHAARHVTNYVIDQVTTRHPHPIINHGFYHPGDKLEPDSREEAQNCEAEHVTALHGHFPEDEPANVDKIPAAIRWTWGMMIHPIMKHIRVRKFETISNNATAEEEEDYVDAKPVYMMRSKYWQPRGVDEDGNVMDDMVADPESVGHPLDDWGWGHIGARMGHHWGHHIHHHPQQKKPVSLDFGCNTDNHHEHITHQHSEEASSDDGVTSAPSVGRSSSSSNNGHRPVHVFIKKPRHDYMRPHHHGPSLTFRCNAATHHIFKHFRKHKGSNSDSVTAAG